MYIVELGNLKAGIATMLQPFADRLKVDIYAKGADADSDSQGLLLKPNTQKGRLVIYFFAGPSVGAYSGGADETYYQAYGYKLNIDQFTGITPSLIGYHIEDEGGQVVAEIVENTIYVLFDLPQYGDSRDSLNILQKIMEAYESAPSLTERRALEAKKRREIRSQSFTNFKKFFERSPKNLAAIKKQYDSILRMSKGDLVVTDEEVRVHLGKTNWKDSEGGDSIAIGDMFFTLYLYEWSGNKFVNVFYLEYNPDRPHMHVYAKGNLCLGNIHEGVSEFLKEREIASAAKAMRLFVQKS